MEPGLGGDGTAWNRHNERLAALGVQVARVAHELNTPVSLIAGSLGTLEQQFDALLHYVEVTRAHAARDPELSAAYAEARVDYILTTARSLLAICDEGVQRVGHVVAQLRGYARRTGAASESLDIDNVLRRALLLAIRGRCAAPPIEWHIDPALPVVRGDAQLLSQAFLNLLTTAIDATSAVPAPRIVIRGRSIRGGAGIEIRIADNGPGIAASAHASVFELFFTTKPAGTGLGLAIAKDAIEQHGGTIAVVDSDRPGAEFIVELPVMVERAAT